MNLKHYHYTPEDYEEDYERIEKELAAKWRNVWLKEVPLIQMIFEAQKPKTLLGKLRYWWKHRRDKPVDYLNYSYEDERIVIQDESV